MELFQAHHQWASRPADQRFSSLEDLHHITHHYAMQAREASDVPYNTLRTDVHDGEVVLVGKKEIPARLTHWSFGQLAARVGAPASYLRGLPATLAVQNLNHGLKLRANQPDVLPEDNTANILMHHNGVHVCRAITSDKYSRIWNCEVAERLLEMQERGWEPARPDIRVSMGDFPALYASDHDMFAFIRLRNRTITQPVRSGVGDQTPMYRGLIYGNSEVGASSLFAMSFYYNEMCGNHIIWGASGVVEFRAKHVGTIRERTQQWAAQLKAYADSSTSQDEAHIRRAASTMIAATKTELLDMLFGKKSLGLSRKAIEASYNACLPEQDGDPLTVWGWVQGATRHSQTVAYQDERLTLDRAAGKVLSMEF